jgi:hypothetical protein
MKRSLLALALLLVPMTAAAFDQEKAEPRVALLRGSDRGTGMLSDALARTMREHLRKEGVDAFTISATLDDVTSDGASDAARDADFFVEIVADSESREHGAFGMGFPHVGGTISRIESRLSAIVRIYDGRTFELVDSHELAVRSTGYAPTEVSIAGERFGASVTLPFAHLSQRRKQTRELTRQAVAAVLASVRPR